MANLTVCVFFLAAFSLDSFGAKETLLEMSNKAYLKIKERDFQGASDIFRSMISNFEEYKEFREGKFEGQTTTRSKRNEIMKEIHYVERQLYMSSLTPQDIKALLQPLTIEKVDPSLTLDKLKKKIATSEAILNDKAILKRQIETINTIVPPNHMKIFRVIGLGNFATDIESEYQMALLEGLMKYFEPHTVIYQEPLILDLEKEYLQELGIEVALADDLSSPLSIQDNSDDFTLILMFHCTEGMYDKILSAYWTKEKLRKVILVGNDLPSGNLPHHFTRFPHLMEYKNICVQDVFRARDGSQKESSREMDLYKAFSFTNVFYLKPDVVELPNVNTQMSPESSVLRRSERIAKKG